MKRGTLILTLVAGLLVFLAVLVLYLPASWFASRLPPQVHCTSLGGSVWHGECLGLVVDRGKFGDATWNLSPLKALTGRIAGDFDLRGGAITARTNLDLRLDGSGELGGLEVQVPIDHSVARQFPRNQRGLVVGRFARLVLDAGGVPRHLEGTVELHDFKQTRPRPIELGSYRLVFDGKQESNGLITGKLTDIGGPFAVDGSVIFTPPNNYVVQGFISGRTSSARDIVREITLNAAPDAAGRREFTFENSF